MKILFLDIDGVLNSNGWYESDEAQDRRAIRDFAERNTPEDWQFHFDPEKIALLDDIVEQTECVIVISSSWRKNRTRVQLVDIFRACGLQNAHQIYGKTINMHDCIIPGNHMPRIRGLEIRIWLEENIRRTNPAGWRNDPPARYCILDDDTDMLYDQRNNFVKTDTQDGLTRELANRVIKILNDAT